MASYIDRCERMISGACEPLPGTPTGVALRSFVADELGAAGFSTGMATFQGGAELPYHVHEVSEAVTILAGGARVLIEGRAYKLFPFDCVHIPAGMAHSVVNAAADAEMLAHSAFASSRPARKFLQNGYPRENREYSDPVPGDPETITRFHGSVVYELAAGAFFRDLFARRLGAVGICGGYGRFAPGSSLPCHIHEYDESITIVSGDAICLVQGKEYQLSGYDTAFVPRHQPHRFVNRSDKPMAMIWVYAGDEPDRVLVNSDYCSGDQIWPGQ